MNVSVEQLAPCRKLLKVEIDPDAVEQAFRKTAEKFQRQARLSGFRPGKAPQELVARIYAKQIADDVKRTLISENYRAAIDREKLHVVTTPDIEDIQFERGQPMQFAATLETAPEFELPEYKGLPVAREKAAVSDADVERALRVLREQQAGYRDVDRPAQSGDFVVVNYRGESEGKPLTEFAPSARGLTEQNKFWMEIRPGSFIPGFTEQLISMGAGEKRQVEVTFPPDFIAPALAGKKGVYAVEILQVKEKTLPEIDDAFAKSFGAETVAVLREGVRRDLANELRFKQKRELRNQLVNALMQRVNFDLPESMVTSETRNVIYNILRENQQRGLSKEMIEQQKNEIYSMASRSAADRVKAGFLLGKIAEKEGIRVEQKEIAARVVQLADQYKIPPDKMLRQLQERDGIGEIQDEILTGKVLDFLEANARVEEVETAPSAG